MPDFSLFHLIRPWALLLILPAIILYWLYKKQPATQDGWSALIDQHLLSWLMPHSSKSKGIKYLPSMLLTFWVITCLSLAGPTWKKTPQPVFSSNSTQVILLDLSLSMDSDDIKPSRLERAKFKIKDYLKLHNEGLTGLVVYAGDGFILSPLTSDKDTIENLLDALSTKIMPLLGSRPELGFKKAIELLDNTGLAQGNIIWFTDGADPDSLKSISDQLDGTPYQLSILAIGTEDGAPIQLTEEQGFLRDNRGNIVIPKLNYDRLSTFAKANNAILTPVTVDDSDVKLFISATDNTSTKNSEKDNKFADDWFDLGYWLILPLLPLVLYSFRHRALLGSLCVFSFCSILMQPAQANPLEDFFLNEDQRGRKLIDEEDYSEAYNTFQDPRWKALSAYRMGSYDSSSDILENIPEGQQTADDLYNQGNALALNGQLDKAIESYNEALKLEPDHQDAQYNKDIVESLKQEQDKEKQQNQNEQGESEEQKQDQQDSQQENSQQESDQQEQDPRQQQQSEKEQQQQQKPELTEQELRDQFEEEEKDQEMEQWLRQLSDDPGGLLRRKMYREYQRRGHKQQVEKNW
ncbi:VWA domain-containing protein [Kangiella sediminilitoris]|uniref:TPR repeat-containing protein n=1 Tax=Kangiella sediminilitoris TaxID=1144748 RepID=A0A1B3B962_9GAMM|nr:VWA domain-containing protein [Kangiella sediminilitoris]AOE49315.1 TPR repeat-containing protein [Kangiella sediminilitoris]